MKSSIRFVVLVIGLGFVLLGATRLFKTVSWGQWSTNSQDASPFSEFEHFVFTFPNHDADDCQNSDARERELFISREFSVSPGQHLNVDVATADVIVETGSENIARVEVFVASHDGTEAAASGKNAEFEIAYSDGVVSVRQTSDRDWNQHVSDVAIQVTIPTEFSVQIATGSGDIQTADLTGDLNLRSGAGDISCGTVKGKTVDLVSSAGDIHIEALDVDENVHVRTSAGDIYADKIKAVLSKLSTSAGDVKIGHYTGSLEASSSAGDLDISDLIGRLIGKTSAGDIQVSVSSAAPMELESQVGDISVVYPSNSSLDLDLAAPEIVVNGKRIKSGSIPNITHHVSSVNGGGSEVHLSTRLGTVRVTSN